MIETPKTRYGMTEHNLTENSETQTSQQSDEATVLLVDDNPQNLKVLYETLKDRGYRLLIANEGEKALALAERHHPEVILLDIMMPVMDGFEVCRQLKESPVTADSAVVFLSALDDVEAKVKGFSLGGADYIAKPFQAQEVIARVNTHARVIQLEREMQARNRQLEVDQSRILNAISEGIYGLRTDGTIVFANPAAVRMVGLAAEELVGENFFSLHFEASEADLIPKADDATENATDTESSEDEDDVLPALATCQQGIAEHKRDIQMRRPDGGTFPVEYRATAKLENDEVVGAVVVFRDISTELENESALEDARTLVLEQRDQLAHASRLSTMGEMAAGFAHEVNQPLTAISNYVCVALRQLAAETIDRELAEQTLHKIEAQSHRASEIIRRIRSFVRKPATGKENVDLPKLLEETRRFAEVDARTNEGGVVLIIDETPPRVYADPIQVQQVALNLIRNALESTRSVKSAQPVAVATRISDGEASVYVRDYGAGVSVEDEENLFLPFFTTKNDGMGIGLSMCRTLIQAQGGEIGFTRPDGPGAMFWFSLPLATETDPAASQEKPVNRQ